MSIPSEILISRAELAQRLGVTEEAVRRRERIGQIRAVKRTKTNQPLYSQSIVAPLQGRTPAFSKVEYDTEAATAVFVLLAEGKALCDIVVELKLHPNVVRSIAYDYADMEGGLVVTGAVMRVINALDLDGNFPLSEDKDLLDVLQNCVLKDCSHCGKRPKSVCKQCVPVLARKIEDV